MEEKEKNEVVELNKEQSPMELHTLPLDESTKDIMERIIEEQDVEQIKDLSKMFNLNQVKKNMVRVVKLNDLLDKVQDQAIIRFEQRPDEISNKELLDYMQVVQNSIEKSQKTIETIDTNPLVQVTNQEINVNVGDGGLDRESKEKVLDVVQQLLKMAKKEPIIDEPIMVNLDETQQVVEGVETPSKGEDEID